MLIWFMATMAQRPQHLHLKLSRLIVMTSFSSQLRMISSILLMRNLKSRLLLTRILERVIGPLKLHAIINLLMKFLKSQASLQLLHLLLSRLVGQL